MAAVVVECTDLDREMEFFVDAAAFRVHLVTPADHPRRVVIERDGTMLELRRASRDIPARVVIETDVDRQLRSPGGSVIEFVASAAAGGIPASVPSLTVVEAARGGFGLGRAGMEYRDLLPDRWGGRFIASHIRIEEGGDVADWVHFHRVRFQLIFVAAGWVDVVYEDQGEPFRMVAGDCVLQPPEIRHRVLRSSPGLEVIEVGCPAEHDTLADHALDLPTSPIRRDRDFEGQRFVRHVERGAPRSRWHDESLRIRDTGIGTATDALAGAVVVESGSAPLSTPLTHHGEFVLLVALSGEAVLEVEGNPVHFTPKTSVAIPAGTTWSWATHEPGHEALVVSLPDAAVHVR